MMRSKGRRIRSTTPIDEARVVAVIEGMQKLDELTWDQLAAKVEYNERSLRRRGTIYDAFWKQKDILTRPVAHPRRTPVKIENETIAYLKRLLASKDEAIKERDNHINSLRMAFVQLIVNGKKEGVDVERLWSLSIEKVL